MIILVGDVHGHLYIKKLNTENFPQGKTLTKEDYVIVLGDFGLLWDNLEREKYWLGWLSDKPWTTLFVDGNHENFDMIVRLPLIDKFDGIVGKVNDSIFHLKRGEIYNIDGNKIFTMGGANSIDKQHRTYKVSWWAEEIPSRAEESNAFVKLQNNDNEVDYILTHTCPERIANLIDKVFPEKDPTRGLLTEIENRTTFKKWYFGHWHNDMILDEKFRMLYDKKMILGE